MCDETEIIVEIKHFFLGQISSKAAIATNRMYLVYWMSNEFIIRNGNNNEAFIFLNKRYFWWSTSITSDNIKEVLKYF